MRNFAAGCHGASIASDWSQLCTWAQLIYILFLLHRNLAWLAVTQRTSKKKCQNREVGAYTRMAAFPGQCIVKMQIHTEGIRQHKRGLTKLPQKWPPRIFFVNMFLGEHASRPHYVAVAWDWVVLNWVRWIGMGSSTNWQWSMLKPSLLEAVTSWSDESSVWLMNKLQTGWNDNKEFRFTGKICMYC